MTEEEFDRELKEAFPLDLLNNFEREHAIKLDKEFGYTTAVKYIKTCCSEFGLKSAKIYYDLYIKNYENNMITAKEARRLAERKYTEVYNAIECTARKGGLQYELYHRSPNQISEDLKEDLEKNGFKVGVSVDYDYDTDHYGHVLATRKIYTTVIFW